MKQRCALAGLFVLVLCSAPAMSDTLLETFDSGISPTRWTVRNVGNLWAVSAPDSLGRLQITKPADNDQATLHEWISGGVDSLFLLRGNFTVTVGFQLPSFPDATYGGYNEALLRTDISGTGDSFSCLRFVLDSIQMSEGYSSFASVVGDALDSTTSGRFRITRQDATMSAWIDRGSGFVLLGALTDTRYLGDAAVSLTADQVRRPWSDVRSCSSLDVRYDNLDIVADMVIPEPTTLSLLALGGLGILRRRAIL